MSILTPCDSKITLQLDKYLKTRQQYLDTAAILEKERAFVLEDLALLDSKIKLLRDNASELSKTIDKYNELMSPAVENNSVELVKEDNHHHSPDVPSNGLNITETLYNDNTDPTLDDATVVDIAKKPELDESTVVASDDGTATNSAVVSVNGKPRLKPQYAQMAIADAVEGSKQGGLVLYYYV
jgi:hypothetical protein